MSMDANPVITARHESWALDKPFTISRGTRTTAEVVVVTIEQETILGRGECVPYSRYGESIDSVIEQIRRAAPDLASNCNREALQNMLPPGAARNALDCALWDWHAKAAGTRIWELAGIQATAPLICAYTLSLEDTESMQQSARDHSQLPLLKIKVDREQAIEKIRTVHQAAPRARLIVDANESWLESDLIAHFPLLAGLGVSLLEQPLPAGNDDILGELPHPVPVAADESCHTTSDLTALRGLYDVVNIKLDKSGGLTEGLRLREAAVQAGMGIMVGCMVGTSLAMAPSMVIGCQADYVDLDGPLLLAKDREPGLRYRSGFVDMPTADLWG